MPKPTTVDEYVQGFPEPARARLGELRDLIHARAPEATETLKWGAPAYAVDTILLMFAGYTNHANFVVTPTTRAAFEDELSGFTTGKASVQLPYADPIPVELLGRMIDYRLRGFAVDGVRWM